MIIFFGESGKYFHSKLNFPQNSPESSTFFEISIRLTTGPSGIMMCLRWQKKATLLFPLESTAPIQRAGGRCVENERALTRPFLDP